MLCYNRQNAKHLLQEKARAWLIVDANLSVSVVKVNRQRDGGENSLERILVTLLSDYEPQACESFESPTRQPPHA